MSYYTKAQKDILQALAKTMERYHKPLRDADVSVQVLMAWPRRDDNGDATGPAVTHNGYPCAAKIRVLSAKDRVARGFDAEMIVDGEKWQESDARQQIAILDHELEHLELLTDAEGSVVLDDGERPKLRCQRHDAQLGWFHAVARRHGESSIEVQQARALITSDAWTQCYLPGMEPAAAE